MALYDLRCPECNFPVKVRDYQRGVEVVSTQGVPKNPAKVCPHCKHKLALVQQTDDLGLTYYYIGANDQNN